MAEAQQHAAERDGGRRVALADQLDLLVRGQEGVGRRAQRQQDQADHAGMGQGDRKAGGEGLDLTGCTGGRAAASNLSADG